MAEKAKRKSATGTKCQAKAKSTPGTNYKVEKKSAPGRKEVEVLGATFEKGKPESVELGYWRQKVGGRTDMLKYLENGERYWYGQEWYGSERRKNPA